MELPQIWIPKPLYVGGVQCNINRHSREENHIWNCEVFRIATPHHSHSEFPWTERHACTPKDRTTRLEEEVRGAREAIGDVDHLRRRGVEGEGETERGNDAPRDADADS